MTNIYIHKHVSDPQKPLDSACPDLELQTNVATAPTSFYMASGNRTQVQTIHLTSPVLHSNFL